MSTDVLPLLTEPMREVLRIQSRQNVGSTRETTPAEQRRQYAAERAYWNEGGPTMAETVDDLVAGPHGPLTVRWHRPEGAVRSVIVFIHGGGFVVGGLDTHDRIMRALAADSGAVVVGVDYSLSPEAKFPQAVHECAAAARHVAERAHEHGVAEGAISLAGDSGGASLALAATLLLRDQGGPEVESLLLYYGMYGLVDSRSRRRLGNEWDGLTPSDLEFYLKAYTSGSQDLADPYLDCLGADLSFGLPPTYLLAATLDPLLDDTLALMDALEEYGVPHQLRLVDGVLHGFLHYSRLLPEAVEALAEGAAFHRSVVAGRQPATAHH
ncbi:acetyl esterase [Georgenia yuyongxinii]|uniref:Acetyl esterase n=1 Tax=Georgenia yuyongxinii TaxID=2589797 RepID=A0A5B8C1T1_9MICO|nr:alpha/beta hydrolase fold domain-containing protein [Georgenia yuyongxinii]QDC24553.1 acetyl esterase [Georgenia yuyongxinii]